MGNKKTLEILIVEDVRKHLETAKQVFDEIDEVETDYARDCKTGLKKLDKKLYDGVISDLSLPYDIELIGGMDVEEAFHADFIKYGKPRGGYEVSGIEKKKDDLVYYFMEHRGGELIISKAESKQIPWMIFCEHGGAGIFFKVAKKLPKKFSGFFSKYKEEEELAPIGFQNGMKSLGLGREGFKADPKGWRIIYKILKHIIHKEYYRIDEIQKELFSKYEE